jgi:methionine biosynthesis protein MetW
MHMRYLVLMLPLKDFSMSDSAAPHSPDLHGTGLVDRPLDPLRYDGHTDDPHEVAGVLQALMPEGMRVLDVGCGTGSVAVVANNNKRNRVLGIEPDAARAKVAASRGIDATCGYLDREFIATKGPFDVIVFSDVLEHLASPDEMLNLASTALKPDGIMLVSVPNVAHWSVRLNLLLGRFDYAEYGLCDSTHLRWFTSRTIQALFESQGFEILAMRYTAGTSLPVYHSRYFRVLPMRLRRSSIRACAKLLPRLFACQFVLKVRRR